MSFVRAGLNCVCALVNLGANGTVEIRFGDAVVPVEVHCFSSGIVRM